MTLTNNRKLLHSPPPAEIGLPVVAGSLMPQTAEQIEHVRQKGAPSFMLNTAHLFDPAEREVEIARLSAVISDGLRISTRVIFHSPNDFQALASANQMSQTYSVTKTEVSRLGSETLAEVTARPLKNTGQNRLVVAGGETSAAVCDGLRVSGMRVWKEIQPGLPFCVSLNDPPRMLVLKSGSFGKPDFFERAIEHLRES